MCMCVWAQSPCDGWIRPWAVRAVSGHTVHNDPEENTVLSIPNPHASTDSEDIVVSLIALILDLTLKYTLFANLTSILKSPISCSHW